MVARSWKNAAAALAIVLLLLMPFPLAPALGQELDAGGDFDIREEFRIELNATGDASITDTLYYDKDWFAKYGFIFEDNPNLLTRRYRADSNVGEVEDFKVDIDSDKATIVVTFTTPGLVYKLTDGWTLFGYGNYELTGEDDGELSLAAAWTISNEFSLFEPMDLDEKVIITLPHGATGAEFDRASGAIEYDLPYETKGNVLADNKTLFTIIFALLMALSFVLLLFLFTHRGGEHALAAAGTVIGPAAPPRAPAQAEPAPVQAPQAQGAGAPAQADAAPVQAPQAQGAGAPAQADAAPVQAPQAQGETILQPRFCKKCGHRRGGPEERFCPKCGTPFA